MARKILLLNGLAILGVICGHAGGWMYLTNVWSGHQPDFSYYDTPTHFALLVVEQLFVFAVPAFLFVSGFFYAYAVRGRRPVSGWKVVRARFIHLLVPYLIWSVVTFVTEAIDGIVYPLTHYFVALVVGTSEGAYFFVPLLWQFYLLSPLVARFAKTRWQLFLFAAGLIQLGVLVIRYLDVLTSFQSPVFDILLRRMSFHYFPSWLFFFALGLVSGFHLHQFSGWLFRYRWGLLVITLALGLATIIEPEILFRHYGVEWTREAKTISGSLYSVAFLLCFMAFPKVSIPHSKSLHELGKKSYGIYLIHWRVMGWFADKIQIFTPWMTTSLVMFLILAILGLGIPLALMSLVSKSPARRAHRYLFG